MKTEIKLLMKQAELIKKWEDQHSFIVHYIDYENMKDKLKVWHLEYLQKISDLKTEVNALLIKMNNERKRGI